jgi:hypothetical protein
VLSHLDRAIELINRTNQLNFTKNRLPENLDEAREKLRKQCFGAQRSGARRQAGLVRVADKYGDYGFVGFFLMHNRRTEAVPGLANQTLMYYCFSCRTLGMFVEHWLYDLLRRPELEVVGEVLTNLDEQRTIDWIRLVPSISEAGQAQAQTQSLIGPEIRITGGCEANPLAHYLTAYCNRISVTGSFPVGALFVRLNSSHLLLSAVKHAGPLLEQELDRLGIAAPLTGTDFFRDAPEGTVFVFSGGLDASNAVGNRIRHRRFGWELHISVGPCGNFVSATPDEIAHVIASAKSDAERRHLEFVTSHVRASYEASGERTWTSVQAAMEELVRRVPEGCKFVILVDDERRRTKDGAILVRPGRVRYNERIKSFAAQYPFVGTVAFGDVIENNDEIHSGGNHYERAVYLRMSEKIVEVARQLTTKSNLDILALS